MATLDASRVGVAAGKVTGAIFTAPAGTALPTDAVTALPEAYQCIGYTSSDGWTNSESSSSTDIRAYEGQAVVYTSQAEYKEEITIKPIQIAVEAFRFIYGDDAVEITDAETGSFVVKHGPRAVTPKPTVIEMVERPGILRRCVCMTQPETRDTATYNGTEASGRSTTFVCIADENGVTMRDYYAFVAA